MVKITDEDRALAKRHYAQFPSVTQGEIAGKFSTPIAKIRHLILTLNSGARSIQNHQDKTPSTTGEYTSSAQTPRKDTKIEEIREILDNNKIESVYVEADLQSFKTFCEFFGTALGKVGALSITAVAKFEPVAEARRCGHLKEIQEFRACNAQLRADIEDAILAELEKPDRRDFTGERERAKFMDLRLDDFTKTLEQCAASLGNIFASHRRVGIQQDSVVPGGPHLSTLESPTYRQSASSTTNADASAQPPAHPSTRPQPVSQITRNTQLAKDIQTMPPPAQKRKQTRNPSTAIIASSSARKTKRKLNGDVILPAQQRPHSTLAQAMSYEDLYKGQMCNPVDDEELEGTIKKEGWREAEPFL